MMISRTAISLAVALPLLVCIIVLLVVSTILLVRLQRQRAPRSTELQQAANNPGEIPNQLATSSKRVPRRDPPLGISQEQIQEAYTDFIYYLGNFIHEWISYDPPSSPPRKDSPTRIEAVLFPEPPPSHPLNDGLDTSIFQNPNGLTTAEISSLLEKNRSRTRMAEHIIVAVLLKSVSLHEGGSPFSSLLPFGPSDIKSLAHIQRMIQGVDLSQNMVIYIANFWVTKSDIAYSNLRREEYHMLFETLFEPYFTGNTHDDKFRRRNEFDVLLDKAIEFGTRVSGHPYNIIEFRWLPRKTDSIMLTPDIVALEYKGGELEHTEELYKSTEFVIHDA